MELMSSLLLCALAVFLPQVLGEVGDTYGYETWLRSANDASYTSRNKIFLKSSGRLKYNNGISVNAAFNDISCRKCFSCMERAVEALKSKTNISELPTVDTKYLENDVPSDHDHHFIVRPRHKRTANASSKVTKKENSKRKRSKRNRHGSSKRKSVTVTKYSVGGEVNALKVKETNMYHTTNKDKHVTTCQVYTVKEHFPCDAPESDVIFAMVKSKENTKGQKKKAVNKVNATTQMTKINSTITHKREVDSMNLQQQSQIHTIDTYVPSTEEVY